MNCTSWNPVHSVKRSLYNLLVTNGRSAKRVSKNEPGVILSRIDEFLKHFPPDGPSVPFPNRAWESLRFQGKRLKDSVCGDPANETFPGAREMFWQQYKQHCAAQGDWLQWLTYCMEPQWAGMFERRRPRRPKGSALFDDLPPTERAEAQAIFKVLSDEWSWRVRTGKARSAAPSNWRRPLLAGAARRLARNPSQRSSEWGKRMRRIKGGKHTQARYREQGWHPLASVRKAWGLTAGRPSFAKDGSDPAPSYDETSNSA
jgi:hypothetical protein